MYIMSKLKTTVRLPTSLKHLMVPANPLLMYNILGSAVVKRSDEKNDGTFKIHHCFYCDNFLGCSLNIPEGRPIYGTTLEMCPYTCNACGKNILEGYKQFWGTRQNLNSTFQVSNDNLIGCATNIRYSIQEIIRKYLMNEGVRDWSIFSCQFHTTNKDNDYIYMDNDYEFSGLMGPPELVMSVGCDFIFLDPDHDVMEMEFLKPLLDHFQKPVYNSTDNGHSQLMYYGLDSCKIFWATNQHFRYTIIEKCTIVFTFQVNVSDLIERLNIVLE